MLLGMTNSTAISKLVGVDTSEFLLFLERELMGQCFDHKGTSLILQSSTGFDIFPY